MSCGTIFEELWLLKTAWKLPSIVLGLLPDTQNCGLRMRRECRERFPLHQLQRKPLVSDPHVRHTRAVMHVGIANPHWRGKRSRYSRRIRNPQFYVSGKRPFGRKVASRLGHRHSKYSVKYILNILRYKWFPYSYCWHQCAKFVYFDDPYGTKLRMYIFKVNCKHWTR